MVLIKIIKNLCYTYAIYAIYKNNSVDNIIFINNE